jgi:hypothetical protein
MAQQRMLHRRRAGAPARVTFAHVGLPFTLQAGRKDAAAGQGGTARFQVGWPLQSAPLAKATPTLRQDFTGTWIKVGVHSAGLMVGTGAGRPGHGACCPLLSAHGRLHTPSSSVQLRGWHGARTAR